MCGITACIGSGQVVDDLLMGLRNLEYRGYDSAGVALRDENSLTVCKQDGEVSDLTAAVRREQLGGSHGIGHTRWSTHGPPTDENAHPHTDCDGGVAVVHNGIIENHDELSAGLRERGHQFSSETDTEVIPHLVSEKLSDGTSTEVAFREALAMLEGSYAVAMVVEGESAVYAARSGSPLVLGIGEESHFVASDVPAFLEFTDDVCYLEDGDVARIEADEISLTDSEGSPVSRDRTTVDWVPEDAQKGEFDHFMHKEIQEQPTALRQTIRGRVDPGVGAVSLEEFPDGAFADVDSVVFVACGTSYHAAMYAASLFTTRGIDARVVLASEYVVNPPKTTDGTMVVGVTQSGETADTLAALRDAMGDGLQTLAVTNVVGSTAARECDDALFIRAGPEIGVAATKTFSSQIATLACLGLAIRRDTDPYAPQESDMLAALEELPTDIEAVLEDDAVSELAAHYADSDAHFFIGRQTGRAVALEAALKLKEISYEHAEGFPAGELKHGPLALVTPDTPVFAIATGRNDQKLRSNVEEIQARSAPVVAIAPQDSPVADVADHVLEVPDTHPDLVGVLANVTLQLLAYHVAAKLDRPIDKPRNLAKSVTVE